MEKAETNKGGRPKLKPEERYKKIAVSLHPALVKAIEAHTDSLKREGRIQSRAQWIADALREKLDAETR